MRKSFSKATYPTFYPENKVNRAFRTINLLLFTKAIPDWFSDMKTILGRLPSLCDTQEVEWKMRCKEVTFKRQLKRQTLNMKSWANQRAQPLCTGLQGFTEANVAPRPSLGTLESKKRQHVSTGTAGSSAERGVRVGKEAADETTPDPLYVTRPWKIKNYLGQFNPKKFIYYISWVSMKLFYPEKLTWIVSFCL